MSKMLAHFQVLRVFHTAFYSVFIISCDISVRFTKNDTLNRFDGITHFEAAQDYLLAGYYNTVI